MEGCPTLNIGNRLLIKAITAVLHSYDIPELAYYLLTIGDASTQCMHQ
jgi:hypothetical protein